jgi:hypothetical protein
MIDGKKGATAPIDHSNFDWADRIMVGYSADLRKNPFTGQMKDIVYKSTKFAEDTSKAADVDSAADYVKQKKSGSELVVNDEVNIDELQFVRLVYQAVKAGVSSISFEGKVNFVGSADKWENILIEDKKSFTKACISIAESVTSEDKEVVKTIMLNTIGGGGWKLVRHVP